MFFRNSFLNPRKCIAGYEAFANPLLRFKSFVRLGKTPTRSYSLLPDNMSKGVFRRIYSGYTSVSTQPKHKNKVWYPGTP